MNSAAISLIQGNLSQNPANFSILRSGSVVTGRVLARNGDGSYSVSLAGQKINVKSESSLQDGSVFSAKVSLKGESIQLSLVKESVSSEILQKFGGTGGNSEISPQVANILSSLGFEPNTESFKILQFMQQIGMKFDVESAKKALKQAKDSENKEEKAQVSLLLEEKGIKSSDERVQAIIGRKHQNENGKRKEESGKRETESGKWKAQVFSCEAVKAYFARVDEAASSHEVGLLSAFNTVLSSCKKDVPLRHWIVLPFEWNFRFYSGNMRLLFDSELKNLEKLVIELNNPVKNHIFVVNYKNAEVSSVKFASDSEITDSKKSHLCEVLSSMFNKKVSVELDDFASLKGFCAGDEKFSMLDGTA